MKSARHFPSTAVAVAVAFAMAAAACGGSDEAKGSDGVAGASSQGGREAAGGSTSEAGASEGGAGPSEVIATFNGCAADDYLDSSAGDAERTILIAAQGLSFTPKCLLIEAGQSVRWEGSLAAHPLAPGNPSDPLAGSADSPILPRSSGSSVEFAFDEPGTFPYYCTLHAFAAGSGMAGVVHVRRKE